MTPVVELLAELHRGELVESAHYGSVAAIAPDGSRLLTLGEVHGPLYPRSANKPLQALALVRAGLRLSPELLALACASHAGADFHVAGARRILAGAGLDESALACTPDLPLDDRQRRIHLAAGLGAEPVYSNCSGKHAAMLATCVLRGWPIESYLDQEHPVQVEVRKTLAELAGEEPTHVAVDGCGAPLFGYSLTGLARAFAALCAATDGPEFEVAQAMRAHPEWVDGVGRSNTVLMRGIPGALAKGGAEGVLAAAVPGGPSVAVKVTDGAKRATDVVLIAVLRRLGVDVSGVSELAIHQVDGHGTVRPAPGLA